MLIQIINDLLPYLFLVILFNTIIFLFACAKKDNGIIDIFYSWGFMLSSLIAFYFSNMNTLSFILTLCVMIWGIRLSFRIYNKNKNKPEDFRYAKWRSEWSEKGAIYFYLRSYVQIYLLQGIIAFIVVSPILYFLSNNIIVNNYIFLTGAIIWIFGFIFEATGDKQLDDFLKDKERLEKEKLMTTGLWRYTRHPNYFGEATMWWGIFTMSILSMGLNYYSIIFLVSPILINSLLRFVSGVPMLEKRWDNLEDMNIKNIWLNYKNKTPAMIPKFW